MSLRFHFSQQHASFSDKAAARLKLADVCPDCGLDDAIVEDHHRGTRVCQRCSVCVELGFMDNSSEWRSGGDQEKRGSGPDPERVGGSINNLLQGGGLTVNIGRNTNNSKGSSMGVMARTANNTLQKSAAKLDRGGHSGHRAHVQKSDGLLLKYFGEIGDICDRLNVVYNDKKAAETLFAQGNNAGIFHGKKIKAAMAACVYTACRLSSNPRSLKEISAAIPEVDKKEIARHYKLLRRTLGISQDEVGVMTADTVIHRFSNNAGIVDRDTITHAIEISKKILKTSDSQRLPSSVATVSIYIASRINPKYLDIVLTDLCKACGVTYSTILHFMRDLKSTVRNILPDSVMTNEDVISIITSNCEGLRQ